MKKTRWLILTTLIIITSLVWLFIWQTTNRGLRVSFLNIGQGDAIFIEAPNGNQMLIDGGAGKVVLSELGQVIPWSDRFIDLVVATHPDADHIGGLYFVLDRFQIGALLESGVSADTQIYKRLESELITNQVPQILARRGMKVILDKDVTFTVLYPDQDTTKMETNDASIVGRLEYKGTSFYLNGDSPLKVENYLTQKDGSQIQSTVLKVGHHGSRTSTGQSFLEVVDPVYAVISAGKNNRYGHPHPEVVEKLENKNIKILSTAEDGRITFKIFPQS
ncbi:MAG: MBL fold metallo-hydrolase [Candidatus Vogelbacteria bacterium]|nr:MBL fold metallo-hydrolase [Candidatus Vogelbacteria bacterium]